MASERPRGSTRSHTQISPSGAEARSDRMRNRAGSPSAAKAPGQLMGVSVRQRRRSDRCAARGWLSERLPRHQAPLPGVRRSSPNLSTSVNPTGGAMSRSGTCRRSGGSVSRERELEVHEGAGIPARSSRRRTRPAARPAHEDAPYLRSGVALSEPSDASNDLAMSCFPASHAVRERTEPAELPCPSKAGAIAGARPFC